MTCIREQLSKVQQFPFNGICRRCHRENCNSRFKTKLPSIHLANICSLACKMNELLLLKEQTHHRPPAGPSAICFLSKQERGRCSHAALLRATPQLLWVMCKDPVRAAFNTVIQEVLPSKVIQITVPASNGQWITNSLTGGSRWSRGASHPTHGCALSTALLPLHQQLHLWRSICWPPDGFKWKETTCLTRTASRMGRRSAGPHLDKKHSELWRWQWTPALHSGLKQLKSQQTGSKHPSWSITPATILFQHFHSGWCHREMPRQPDTRR